MRYIFFIFLALSLYAQSLDTLLQAYRSASELSKITKSDSAGFVYVYTREDLERMQAYTLADILRTVPGLNYTLSPNYLNLFSLVSTTFAPPTIARLYINDHDVTSASFGSALLIWGAMPVEYIDHIEVYKGASSIEFGDESAVIVIKVYTKLPARELGNKLRIITDHRGSKGLDLYTAQLFDDSSLFGYVHGYDLQAKKYRHGGYTYRRDKKDFLAFLQYTTPDYSLEAAHYSLKKDPFIGYGISAKPRDGGLHAYHSYVKLSKRLWDAQWTLSLDRLRYSRRYQEDAPGIYTSGGFVHSYHITYDDTIAAIKCKKHIQSRANSLLLGGFYKYKGYKSDGNFDSFLSDSHSHVNLFSLYAEDSYSFDPDTLLILSLKGDFYRYAHGVKDHNQKILRIGLIKNLGKWQFKGFYTQTYIPAQFFSLYSPNDMPLRANPRLKFPTIELLTFGGIYKHAAHTLKLKGGLKHIKDYISYSPARGYYNQPDKQYYDFVELNYAYTLDNDRFMLDIVKGDNSKRKLSPDLQINLRTLCSYGKFDIYNELLYKKNYTFYTIHVKRALDYTLALQYHYSPDLTLGFKAQNLLDEGFEQAYRSIASSIPVFDRRYILSMEYTF